MEIKVRRENLGAGICGAILGGICGGAVIVALGMLSQGLLSMIAGIFLGYCTFKGYNLLGGRIHKAGICVCIGVILVIPYLAYRTYWAIEIMEMTGWLFGDCFLYVHDMVNTFWGPAVFIKYVLFHYAFAALGTFGILKQIIKHRRSET